MQAYRTAATQLRHRVNIALHRDAAAEAEEADTREDALAARLKHIEALLEQLREGRVELSELAAGLNPVSLGEATRAMTADLLGRLEGAIDEDATFVPVDPVAEDPFATGSDEMGLAWTLGHVIVHLTASAEESAFLAAELARGVPHHGRSRHEVAWSTMVTTEGCRERLRESERMILATLMSWPDQPHLDVVYTTSKGATRNAPARFLGGLLHLDSHRAQVSEILRQARVARISSG